MTSCERCWVLAQQHGMEYSDMLRIAENGHHPCTKDDEDGRRLRAGQFWDAERKVDSRSVENVSAGAPSE